MWKLSAFAALSWLAAAMPLAGQPVEERVATALLALPEELRDGAAVVTFENGERVDLRAGTNGMFCRADDPETPGIAIWCYPQSHDDYARRWYRLAASGMSPKDVDAKITEEIKSGALEWPDAAVNYNLVGRSLDNLLPNTVVFMPFARGKDLGLSEERNFHRPWLMNAGTAFAHIMIPGQ